MIPNQSRLCSVTSVRMPLEVWVLVVGAGLLPLAIWPALADPFETPKRMVLSLMGLAVIAGWTACPSRLRDLPQTATLLVTPLILMVAIGWLRGIPGSDALLLDHLATTVVALAAAGVDRRGAKVILMSIVFSVTFLSLVTCLQFVGLDLVALIGGEINWRHYADKMRMYGTLGNPSRVALVAAMGLPIAIGLLAASRQSRWQGRLLMVATGFMALAIFVSFSKAAMGVSLASLVLLWLWAERRRAWSWRRRSFTVTVLLVWGLAFLWMLPHYSAGQNRPDQTMMRPWSEATHGRLMLWQEGLKMARQHPLWGLGPTGLSRGFASGGLQARHAHNDYIEVFTDGGLLVGVGSILAMATLLLIAYRRCRQRSQNATPLSLTLALLVVATLSLVDFPMQRTSERALIFILAGLLISRDREPVPYGSLWSSWRGRLRFGLAGIFLVLAVPMTTRMMVSDRLLWRAEGLERYGYDEQAEAYYRQAVPYSSSPFRIYQGLGRIALKQNRVQDALEYGRVAYQFFPDPAASALIRTAQLQISSSMSHSVDVETLERTP